MRRRDFLASCAVVAAPMIAVRAPEKPIIRLPVDCDLSVNAMHWAAQLAGWVDPPGTYRLRVHPVQAPWAEQVLRRMFGAEWRCHLVVDDSLPDVDEWYLEGANAIVYSAGA